MWTYESLEVLTKASLMNLAKYNNIEGVNMRMLKGEMIETILNSMKVKEKEEMLQVLPPASVRIQRIRESQE